MHDAEIFGLMMALNVEADLWAIDRDAAGLDQEAALDWLRGDGWSDLARIVDDERLLGRFWTLFATRLSLGEPDEPVFQTLTRMADDIGVLAKLGFDPGKPDAPIGLSKLAKQGKFRAPDLSPRVETDEKAMNDLFVAVMNDVIGGMGLPHRLGSPHEAIDPSLELVAIAPIITIARLPKETDGPEAPDPFESGLDDEFIQLSWPHRGRVARSGFTAQLLPYAQRLTGASFSSVPAVGGVQGARAWIRVRLDDVIDSQDGDAERNAAIVVLQARCD
jgi:hypothetical protein